MKKLPKTVYVSIENKGTQDEYLRAETNTVELEDGEVGIYTLAGTKKKSTSVHLN